jgi:ADP-ribosylglycohydrolase
VIGGIVGSLVGDALGVPVEFASRADRDKDPVTSMRGFGTWNQPAGTWSDDGALLLCTAESLINEDPNEEHTGQLYVRWLRGGHWAVRGNVFDVGGATRAALERIARGTPAATAGGVGEGDNGNGSLMRILPVAMRFADTGPDIAASFAMRWSAITHRHPRSQLACAYLSLLALQLMHGASPEEGHLQTTATFDKVLMRFPSERSHFQRLLDDDFGLSRRQEIRSGGYVIDTLEAAVWCLLQGGSYSDVVLRAVNLGGDTDTTGCVAGGLAGAWLGIAAIPRCWIDGLAKNPTLDDLLERFVCVSGETAR